MGQETYDLGDMAKICPSVLVGETCLQMAHLDVVEIDADCVLEVGAAADVADGMKSSAVKKMAFSYCRLIGARQTRWVVVAPPMLLMTPTLVWLEIWGCVAVGRCAFHGLLGHAARELLHSRMALCMLYISGCYQVPLRFLQ